MKTDDFTFAPYRGRRVFLTGHTGFKGSWLALWLRALGAEVFGFALAPESSESHFETLLKSGELELQSTIGDIRDLESVRRAMIAAKPDMVFHLAAQPIVLRSYADPIETFSTNVMGTLNVLEAARRTNSVRAFVNVTSDKCYENREWEFAYRENDPMGGYDPYSASKGCAEILSASYQQSYLAGGPFLLASARAGNVIGGGDWAQDRIVPDIMRATKEKKSASIRNPTAVRPWQHVLEPLHGYLRLGLRLLNGERADAVPFNFGPNPELCMPVRSLIEGLKHAWPKHGGLEFSYQEQHGQPETEHTSGRRHEAHFLRLDSTRARTRLGWQPILSFDETTSWTSNWYSEFLSSGRVLSSEQLRQFSNRVEHR